MKLRYQNGGGRDAGIYDDRKIRAFWPAGIIATPDRVANICRLIEGGAEVDTLDVKSELCEAGLLK